MANATDEILIKNDPESREMLANRELPTFYVHLLWANFHSEFSSALACIIFWAMSIELTEKLLSEAAGWDVMKFARASLAQGQVVSSYWAPPLLRGVVHSGDVSL